MALNLSRFCLALNHEDPEVVIRGLKEFQEQVIHDHDALESFGYNGRPPSQLAQDILNPTPVTHTVGLLLNLIEKSPDLEEFFILWNIPSRDDDKSLCAHHMSCLAIILHCSKCEHEIFCNRIVSRILHEYTKSIFLQLSTGHTELVHATLGLLLAMSRSSQRNARDVYQKLISNSSAMTALTLRGKSVSWMYKDDIKVITDSRFLLLILTLKILEAANDDLLRELLSNNSLLRKLISTINKDNKPGMVLFLDGIRIVQRNKYYMAAAGVKHPLVDFTFQNKLFLLYTYDDSIISDCVHRFVLDFSQSLAEMIILGKKNSLSALPRQLASQLIKNLSAHENLRHREIQMILLKAQPSLLSQCIATIKVSWDAQPSITFISALSHLTYLISNVTSDHQQRAILKSSINASADESIQNENKIKEVIDSILASIIPQEMTKKDFSKLLTHGSPLIVHLGLEFIFAVMKRLVGVFSEAAGTCHLPSFQLHFTAAFHKYIPEYHQFLSLRGKLLKVLNCPDEVDLKSGIQENTSNAIASDLVASTGDDSGDMEVSGLTNDLQIKKDESKDFHAESGIVTISESERRDLDIEKISLQLLILHEIIDRFMLLQPFAASESSFDETRLIDDIIPWNSAGSQHEQLELILQTMKKSFFPQLIRINLRILQRAMVTGAKSCRWMGSKDDATKLLTNLIVMQDWKTAVKKSAFCKALLLASLLKLPGVAESEHELAGIRDIFLSARDLIVTIFIESGMFRDTSSLTSFELKLELVSWIDLASPFDDSILSIDSLFRISYHWKFELISTFYDFLHPKDASLSPEVTPYVPTSDFTSVSYPATAKCPFPFSPLIFGSILLASGSLDAFKVDLPTYIKSRLTARASAMNNTVDSGADQPSTTSIDFFYKFNNGYRLFIDGVLVNLVVDIFKGPVRFIESYLRTLKLIKNCISCDVAVRGLGLRLWEEIECLWILENKSLHNPLKIQMGKLLGLLSVSSDATSKSDSIVPLKMSTRKSKTITPSNVEETLINGLPPLDWLRSAKVASRTSVLVGLLPHTGLIISSRFCAGLKSTAESEILDIVRDHWFLYSQWKLAELLMMVSTSSFETLNPLLCDLYSFMKSCTTIELSSMGPILKVAQLGASRGHQADLHKTNLISTSKASMLVVKCMKLLSKVIQISMRNTFGDDISTDNLSISICCQDDENIQNASTTQLSSKSLHETMGEYLTSLVIGLLNAYPCDDVICSALMTCADDFASALSPSSEINTPYQSLLHILCAAAMSYYTKVYSRSKTSLPPISANSVADIPLWEMVTYHLLKSYAKEAPSSTRRHQASLFSLGWIMQRFIQSPNLRSLFVNMALTPIINNHSSDSECDESMGGFSMLDFGLSTNNSSRYFRDVDAIASSVLSSFDILTAQGILPAFAKAPKVSHSRSNIFSCPVFKFETTCTHLNGSTMSNKVTSLTSFSDVFSVLLPSWQQKDLREKFHSVCGCEPSAIIFSQRIYEIFSSERPTLHLLLGDIVRDTIDNSVSVLSGKDTYVYQQKFLTLALCYLIGVPIPRCSGQMKVSELLNFYNRYWDRQLDTSVTSSVSESFNTETRRSLIRLIIGTISMIIGDHEPGENNSKELPEIELLENLLSHDDICSHPLVTNVLSWVLNVPHSERVELIRWRVIPVVVKVLPLLSSSSASSVSWSGAWCSSLVLSLEQTMSNITNTLTESSELPASTYKSKIIDTSYLSANFHLLRSLLDFNISTSVSGTALGSFEIQLKDNHQASFTQRFKKFTRTCLKHGISLATGMNNIVLEQLFATILAGISCDNSIISSVTSIRSALVSTPMTSDIYFAETFLRLLISHSKFSGALKFVQSTTDGLSKCNRGVLRLILQLIILSNTDVSKKPPDDTIQSLGDEYNMLFEILAKSYSGTMSEEDRLILRILHLLEKTKGCPAVASIRLHLTSRSKAAPTPKFDYDTSNVDVRDGPAQSKVSIISAHWLVSFINTPTIYSTLSEFPMWRGINPQPIWPLEHKCCGYSVDVAYKREAESLCRQVTNQWSNCANTCADVSKEKSPGNDDGVDEDIDHEMIIHKDSDRDEDNDDDSENESDSDSLISDVPDTNLNAERLPGDDDLSSAITFESRLTGNDDSSFTSRDLLLNCSDKVYDPCFWLPVIHWQLHCSSSLISSVPTNTTSTDLQISMRQLANNGVISFVIASLCSSCPMIRTYALSCMTRIFTCIRQQTPHIDAAFRERPQLLLLLNFIRNQFSNDTGKADDASRKKSDNSELDTPQNYLPPSIALFLGRACVHILQPNHEIYAKVSKYILSRPFCDKKDLPIFESAIMETDSENPVEIAERLTSLRMLRDNCLHSRQDHINMCRKNAYNHLMLLFPMFARDPRLGHAVIDIFDKALGNKYSARYLIEKCNFVIWLGQMASLMHSLHLKMTMVDGKLVAVSASSNSDGLLLAAPPSLIPRVIFLLRKAVGVSYLLSVDSSESWRDLHHRQILGCLTSILDDVSSMSKAGVASIIPNEYFKQLGLCLWDWATTQSVMQQSSGEDSSVGNRWWTFEQMTGMLSAVFKGFKPIVKSEKVDLVLSLMSLIGNSSFPAIERYDATNTGSRCISNESPILAIINWTTTYILEQNGCSLSEQTQEGTSTTTDAKSTIEALGSPQGSTTVWQKDLAIAASKFQESNESLDRPVEGIAEIFKSSYCSAVNVMDIDSILSLSSLSNEAPGNLSDTLSLKDTLNQSWDIFGSVDWNKTPLPCTATIGSHGTFALCAKAVLVILQRSSKASALPNIELMRWCQLVSSMFIASEIPLVSLPLSAPAGSDSVISSQILSQLDSATNIGTGFSKDRYSTSDVDIVLMCRLAMISLLTRINIGTDLDSGLSNCLLRALSIIQGSTHFDADFSHWLGDEDSQGNLNRRVLIHSLCLLILECGASYLTISDNPSLKNNPSNSQMHNLGASNIIGKIEQCCDLLVSKSVDQKLGAPSNSGIFDGLSLERLSHQINESMQAVGNTATGGNRKRGIGGGNWISQDVIEKKLQAIMSEDKTVAYGLKTLLSDDADDIGSMSSTDDDESDPLLLPSETKKRSQGYLQNDATTTQDSRPPAGKRMRNGKGGKAGSTR